jgi:hypothetical protein
VGVVGVPLLLWGLSLARASLLWDRQQQPTPAIPSLTRVQVVAAKAAVIARTPQLHAALGHAAQASADGVCSSSYNLVAGGRAPSATKCTRHSDPWQLTSGTAARWSTFSSR